MVAIPRSQRAAWTSFKRLRLDSANVLSLLAVLLVGWVLLVPLSFLIIFSFRSGSLLAPGGFTDNVSFFVNVVFPSAGTYWVQTLADTVVLEEFPLIVTDAGNIPTSQPAEEISETIN